MKRQTDGNPILPWALLAIPVLWLSALLATGYEDGMTLFDLMGRFNLLMERPFALHWTPHTLKFLLVGWPSMAAPPRSISPRKRTGGPARNTARPDGAASVSSAPSTGTKTPFKIRS